MLRWIMVALAACGFALVFLGKSPGLLGLGFLLGLIGLCGAVFALAADRVAAQSRPESVMLSGADIAALRARAEARSNAARAPSEASASSATDNGDGSAAPGH